MIDFDFCVPTKLYFGKDKELQIGDILYSLNVKRVLIVIGKGSIKKSGLFDRVIEKIKTKNINYSILEGVRANPEIGLCKKGIEIARDFKADFILAIGGGSVIDTAKSIAVGYYYDSDPFDFNLHSVKPLKVLPIGVILTISASGSEMSNSCVIQNDSTNIKMGFNSELIRPVFAIENPTLSFTVNKEQTAYGIVDIIMHTLERYLVESDNNEPADRFAEGLIKSVIEAGKKVMENPCDYKARAVLMSMSSLSHCGLTNFGKKFIMPVHQLEHALSGLYPNVAHGAGLALLWPNWAKYYLEIDANKFACLAHNVFDYRSGNIFDEAKYAIQAFKDYFAFLNMPSTYTDLNISSPNIEKLVELLTNNGQRVIYHHLKPMDASVAFKIYQSANTDWRI